MDEPAEAERGSWLTDLGEEDLSAAVLDRLTDARLGPEAILGSVTSSLSRLRPGTWVAVLLDKDPRSLRIVTANHGDPLMSRYVEDMYASGVGAEFNLATRVIETGEPFVVPPVPLDEFFEMVNADVRGYVATKSPPMSPQPRRVGAALVPMRARGATVGALGVFDSSLASRFTQPEVDWLQAIADRTAVAAENAQLYEDASRRLVRLTALRSIGLAMSGSPDLRLTLQVILDQVVSGLAVDAADLLLLDDAGSTLEVAVQAGFQSTSIPDYRLPVDDRLPGRLLARPRVESVTERSAFSQFRRRTLFAREGFRAYCAAPLVARGSAIGVLEVLHRSALQPDEEWVAFLEALASCAAIAIEGARMHERLESTSRPGRGAADRGPRLSPLERQILGLVVEGTTNSAIAQAVHLSQSTVKFHVRQILQKVGAGNRTELARVATREGWV